MEPSGVYVVVSVAKAFGEPPPEIDDAPGGALEIPQLDTYMSLRIAGPFVDEQAAQQYAEEAGGADAGMHAARLHDPTVASPAAFAIGLS